MRSADNSTPSGLVFYQPHANIWFKNPVRKILRNQRLPSKYEALFDRALAGDEPVYLSSSLIRTPGLKGWIKYLLEPLEMALWCRLNRVPLSRIGFVLRKRSLAGKSTLFLMHYGNFTHELEPGATAGRRLATYLSDAPIRKVVHMTHYAYHPRIGAENLRELRPDLLVAENQLQENSAFFRRFFDDLGTPFRTLPYTAAARFKKTTEFASRTNKAVATGSITYRLRVPEFVEFFGTDELQPLRREIYNHAAENAARIESMISDLDASRSRAPVPRADSLIRSLARRLFGKHPQLSYYKKDIVAIYNRFTMFVVPEEICDLPAIGFIEGMACGCVYLGLDNPMYRDLGMIPGVHYLTYDGTLADLNRTIERHQDSNGQRLLEQIAVSGEDFARRVMHSNTVYDAFLADLSRAAAHRPEGARG